MVQRVFVRLYIRDVLYQNLINSYKSFVMQL